MAVDVGTAIAYLDLNATSFNSALEQSQKALKTFSDSSSGLGDKISALGGVMSNVGSSLTQTLTTPILGFAESVVEAGMSFDATMSKVKAISGATEEEFQNLRDAALEMGKTTKFTTTEAAEALVYMGMAGWDAQEMIAGLPGVMNLAAASGADLGITSDIVTDALTAFGLTADDAAGFVDVLAMSSARSNTDVVKMGETFKYVAPIAGTLGYSVQDTALAIGLMANSGIKASQAGTSLRMGLTRLVSPTDDAAVVMDELGISVTNADGTMKDFDTTMGILREAFGGLTEAEQLHAASTIFGKQAMSGMLAVINASTEEYNSLKNEIYNCDGAAQTMSDTMMDNLQGSITLCTSALQVLYQRLYDLVEPMLRKLIDTITDVVNWFSSLSDEELTFIVQIGAVVAAIGPALLIFGRLLTVVGNVAKIFQMVSGILGGFSPIILAVVAGIALLVAGFVEAYKSSNQVRDAISQLGTIAQRVIFSVINFLKQLWTALKPIIDIVVKVLANLIEILLPPLVKLLGAISSVLEVILPLVGKLFEWVAKLAEIILNVLGPVLEFVAEILGLIIEGIAGFIQGISDVVKKLFGLKDDFKKSGKEAARGFSEGIEEGTLDTENALTNFGNKAKSTTTNILGIVDGKSSVFEEFGLGVGTGLASGIDSGTESVVASVDNMGMQVESSFQSHQERLDSYYQKEIDDWNRYTQEELAIWQDRYNQGLMSQEEYNRAVSESTEWGLQNINRLEAEWADQTNALKNEKNLSYEEQLQGHLDRVEQRHQFNLQQIEVQTQSSVDRINQEYNQGYITREQMLEQTGVAMQVKQERIDVELLNIREEKNAEQEYMERIHAQEMESIQIGSAEEIKDQKIRIDNEYLESDRKYTEESKKNTTDMTAENIKQVAMLATSIGSTAATMWTPLVMITANSAKQIQDIVNQMVVNVGNSLNNMRNSISAVSSSLNVVGRSVNGSHAAGLDYVPFNGYVARLHEGERVLTKQESKDYSQDSGAGKGGDTFNFYNTKPNPYEYARQMKLAKKELLFG